MTDRVTRAAARGVRAWHRLVTAGLPAELRDRRREEIESDLWESLHDPRAPRARAAWHLLWRLWSGAADDIVWRTAQSGTSVLRMSLTTSALCACVGLAVGLHLYGSTVSAPTVSAPAAPPAASVLWPPPAPPPPPDTMIDSAFRPDYAHVSYRLEGDGQVPVLTQQVRPFYPPVLQAANVRATVVIAATVTRSGRVTNVRAVKPSLLLTQAAVDAVRQWRFSVRSDPDDRLADALTVTVSFGV